MKWSDFLKKLLNNTKKSSWMYEKIKKKQKGKDCSWWKFVYRKINRNFKKKKTIFKKTKIRSDIFSISGFYERSLKARIFELLAVFFLRKVKIFNKGRYSRNRQNYRTGVYLCL
jgi:hypothetical protein